MLSNCYQLRKYSFLIGVFCITCLGGRYHSAYGDTNDSSDARVLIVVDRPQATLHDHLELARLGRERAVGRLLGQFLLGPIFTLPDDLSHYMSEMLAEDLRDLPTIYSTAQDKELQKITVLTLQGDPVKGRGIVVAEDDQRYLSRDAKGHCYSLPKTVMHRATAP